MYELRTIDWHSSWTLFYNSVCWWIPWCVTRRLSIEVVSSQSHFPWWLELACSLLEQRNFFDQKLVVLISFKITPAIEFTFQLLTNFLVREPVKLLASLIAVLDRFAWKCKDQKLNACFFEFFLQKQDRLTLWTFLLRPLVSTGVTVLKIFEPSLSVKCL